ncbi:MAG: hypothetical protein WBC31_00290 [Candidatus Phosphoribacter baldrii]|jgi:hypothetical protein
MFELASVKWSGILDHITAGGLVNYIERTTGSRGLRPEWGHVVVGA